MLANLIDKLQQQYPTLHFTPGKSFYWSPETNEVFYNDSDDEVSIWSLLHETGHAICGHKSYSADLQLVTMEIEAWEHAKKLAASFGMTIDESHIQDCLDTYRDWLHSRSICPKCGTKCLQQDNRSRYYCQNCHASWKVSTHRFNRSYRAGEKLLPT